LQNIPDWTITGFVSEKKQSFRVPPSLAEGIVLHPEVKIPDLFAGKYNEFMLDEHYSDPAGDYGPRTLVGCLKGEVGGAYVCITFDSASLAERASARVSRREPNTTLRVLGASFS
jgi:hypothetical protein